MTQVPATLSTPRGSMGEQVDDLCSSGSEHIGQDFRAASALSTAARPYKTLAEWHREFPHLTRTEGSYRPWDKSTSEAA
jgi:hypothetical protein